MSEEIHHFDTTTKRDKIIHVGQAVGSIAPRKHIDTGGIKNKQTAVNFPDGEGFPDGMTTDAEGMLWIAHWKGWKVSRWNPATGKKLEEILVPAKHVTSCTFGGEDLDEMYITTASPDNDHDTDHDTEHGQPHAGGVFCIKTQTKGLRTNLFEG